MAIYSDFFPLKMVIFHSYVSLPEGNHHQPSLTLIYPIYPIIIPQITNYSD